jgi:hypothetical protein
VRGGGRRIVDGDPTTIEFVEVADETDEAEEDNEDDDDDDTLAPAATNARTHSSTSLSDFACNGKC